VSKENRFLLYHGFSRESFRGIVVATYDLPQVFVLLAYHAFRAHRRLTVDDADKADLQLVGAGSEMVDR